MPEVVTFGEPLILFAPEEAGLLRDVNRFRKYVVGAELNLAVGVSRLGRSAGWFGRVGADGFGEEVGAVLRAEGVDSSRVVSDPQAPTAVMFKEYRGFGDPRVLYYRKHSAASCLSPADVDREYIAGARYLHATGITAALSDSCWEAVTHAMQVARTAGVSVSFDPNIRRKLMTAEMVHEKLLPLVAQTDILLLGLDEGELLFGVRGTDAVLEAATARGVRTVVVKLGDQGCVARQDTTRVTVPAYPVAQVVDTVGAGDGFDAGFLSGLLWGLDLQQALQLGALVGAAALTVRGDYEGYPLWAEARALLGLAPQLITR